MAVAVGAYDASADRDVAAQEQAAVGGRLEPEPVGGLAAVGGHDALDDVGARAVDGERLVLALEVPEQRADHPERPRVGALDVDDEAALVAHHPLAVEVEDAVGAEEVVGRQPAGKSGRAAGGHRAVIGQRHPHDTGARFTQHPLFLCLVNIHPGQPRVNPAATPIAATAATIVSGAMSTVCKAATR